jgi:hypothetical protein
MWDSGYDTSHPTFSWAKRLIGIRSKYPSLRKGDVQVAWSTANVGPETDAGIFAFERFGGDGGGSYALVILNSNQQHPSTPRFGGDAMQVLAPPGTVLVDTLLDGEPQYTVESDATLDITVPPMSAVLLVPEAEYKPL